MILTITNSIIIILFISCITISSPVGLGALILCIASILSVILRIISTGWFGLIIFIIYVGGILVIFAYFAALQPNQHIITWRLTLIPTFLVIININTPKRSPLIWSTIVPHTTKIYSQFNLALPICIALILFLTLIIVVKVSYTEQGPLRPFKYV